MPKTRGPVARWLALLWRDKFAFFAAIFLLIVLLCALFGPALLETVATKQNLRGRNAPPFDFSRGWLYVLGADALGRPLLARIMVAAQNTMLIAGAAVLASPADRQRAWGSSRATAGSSRARSSCGWPTSSCRSRRCCWR